VNLRPAAAKRTLIPVLLPALLLAAACSGDEPAPTDARAASPAPPKVAARAHAHSPALDALRTALDRGDKDAAEKLLDAAASAGPEEQLLLARWHALDPRGTIEALRRIESARSAWPENPDVYATAAEIYAARGSFETAWSEIQRGDRACPPAAELHRARGVVWICRENGATRGLEELLKARAIDPDLPFCDRPLAQAHLLVAKLEQQKKNQDKALAHVRASLTFDATDVDARRLLSEVQAARGDFAGAIATVESLVKDGVKLEAELASLHKKAGIALLLVHDRSRALEHFATARDMGLSAAELSSGARLLEEEAQSLCERGVGAYEKGDREGAETLFRAALRFDPASLAARNHLAVVLFQAKRCAEAADLWRAVLADARAEKIELPEPVHLNLASAQICAGDTAGARATLAEYLEQEPAGEWVARTRTMATALDEGRLEEKK
jgi:tetratricopeptide (TPR) repeat protein